MRTKDIQIHKALLNRVSDFSVEKTLQGLKSGDVVRLTYLNPMKLCVADLTVYEELSVRVDGFFLAGLIQFLTGRGVERASFDFSSMASEIFHVCAQESLRVGVVGASPKELEVFSEVIHSRYGIYPATLLHGYFEADQQPVVLETLIKDRCDVVIIGMGGVKQDEFASYLASRSELSIFTCGAFISQTASGGDTYYPKVISDLELRWLYRFWKEPRVIFRTLKFYLPYALFLGSNGRIKIWKGAS